VVDPGADRHQRVSIRGSTALVGNGTGGSPGLAARVVDPGFDRHQRASIRVPTALVGFAPRLKLERTGGSVAA